jgi:hypothetical protein
MIKLGYAALTPDPGVNSEKHRTRRHHGAIPEYPKEFTDTLSVPMA